MKRREFIALAGGAAAWPVAARAQQSARVYRIAAVHTSTPASELNEHGSSPAFRAFFEEIRRLGYDEGRNLAVARYSGGGHTEHYAELAQQVVRTKPDVIVTTSVSMVRAFKAASSTIPIVANTSDPVAYGIAASLARPGGNYTGAASDTGSELYQKTLELLKEAIPKLSTVGLVAKSGFWNNSFGLAVREAAQHLGIRLIFGALDSFQEVDYRNAFEVMAQRRVDAVLISDEAEHLTNRKLIVELAETSRLPTMTTKFEIVEVGGLIAYASDIKGAYRYVAACVDKILQGADPGGIPIYQPARLSLAINLKTAKALGLVIPASLLARADVVIE
jgi:putative ABC transport system substrate-binding protein